MIKSNEMRLQRIQRLAYEIMDEMNLRKERESIEILTQVIDNLSRAVGDLSDPSGNYSLNYLEEKVGKAHTLLFRKK